VERKARRERVNSVAKVGRPAKYKTPGEMQKVIDEYFNGDAFIEIGDARIFAPTVSGLAYALGMSTQAVRDYECKEEFLGTIKGAKQKIEIALEQKLYGQTVTGTIFNLKNNFGWKDKSEQTLSGDKDNPLYFDKIERVIVKGE
jgi:hypothetical protein